MLFSDVENLNKKRKSRTLTDRSSIIFFSLLKEEINTEYPKNRLTFVLDANIILILAPAGRFCWGIIL